MENITVQFPGVLALDNVKFNLYPGEVHVLLGENGAGKSTIMKVLAGVNSTYSGSVIYKGEQIECRDVNEQIRRGISIIFQETNLFTNLTVAENIYLGRQPKTRSGNIDWKKMNSDARCLLDSIGVDISEKSLVSALSVGQMQMVEIAKALSFNSDILIMDEPTSALTDKEVNRLFEIISDLKSKGIAIVYISHRLEEVLKIGDRITVFRDGKYIDTIPVKGVTIDTMINMMVGRDLSEQYPKIQVPPGEVILEVRGLNQKSKLFDISFSARGGEITGFYGLMGAGRTELMRCIFGADRIDSGDIILKGQKVSIKNCKKAKEKGIALLTEDRKYQGLILDFSILDNIAITNLDKVSSRIGISDKKNINNCKNLCSSLKIKTPSIYQNTKYLSGGNQQKVVVAKWLNTSSEVIIFDEPTRGIDVGAKVEIYNLMNELKRQGKAIIMVSSELPEILGISDKLYVMHDGRITGSFESLRGLTENDILKYAVK